MPGVREGVSYSFLRAYRFLLAVTQSSLYAGTSYRVPFCAAPGRPQDSAILVPGQSLVTFPPTKANHIIECYPLTSGLVSEKQRAQICIPYD